MGGLNRLVHQRPKRALSDGQRCSRIGVCDRGRPIGSLAPAVTFTMLPVADAVTATLLRTAFGVVSERRLAVRAAASAS